MYIQKCVETIPYWISRPGTIPQALAGALEYTAPRWEGEDTPIGEGVTNGWATAHLRPTGLCDSLRTTKLLALARTIWCFSTPGRKERGHMEHLYYGTSLEAKT